MFMTKTKPYRKVVKILKDNGWVHTRTDGSH
ncbi:type II toxin-antitoxin system HicA family toxin [Peptoniphilus harei]|nr:type II toxin-antitoxin system HicA family toxin [Peptoniphilus harei]